MRLRFLTAAIALFAAVTALFAGFTAPQAGAAPATAEMAAVGPDHVPDYCLKSNAPPICWAFQANDDLFSKIDLSDLVVDATIRNENAGKIIIDDINSPCFRSNPPRWCWVATFDHSDLIDPSPVLAGQIDLLHDALIYVDTPVIERVFSVGGVRVS